MNRRSFIKTGLLWLAAPPAIIAATPQQVLLLTKPPSAPAASGVGGFAYYSTTIDGSTYLSKTGALAGIADGKQFTLSFWMKMVAGDTTLAEIFSIGPASLGNDSGFHFYRRNDGYLGLMCRNAAGTLILDATCYTNTFLLADGWAHWFISANLATTTVNFCKNGAADVHYANTVTDDTINFTTGVNSYLGWLDNNFGNFMISEFWFDTSYTASPSAWRNGAHPANLGVDGSTPTGNQPKVYFHNSYSTFATNLGTGGNYSVAAGSLIDGGSDKP